MRLVALLLVGCGGDAAFHRGVARTLDCPEDQIVYETLWNGARVARGCGRSHDFARCGDGWACLTCGCDAHVTEDGVSCPE